MVFENFTACRGCTPWVPVRSGLLQETGAGGDHKVHQLKERRRRMARLICLVAALVQRQCPKCKEYYDPSNPAESYPHNNH